MLTAAPLCAAVAQGPEPWRHRVSGKKGELRVVSSEAGHSEPDVVLFNEENPDGKRFEHPVGLSCQLPL